MSVCVGRDANKEGSLGWSLWLVACVGILIFMIRRVLRW